jgi:hemerythrin superfamily protein
MKTVMPWRVPRVNTPREGGLSMAEIYELIKTDHNRIRGMLDSLLYAESDIPSRLRAVTEELELHLSAEEKSLYKVLKRTEGLLEQALEAIEEHQVLRLCLDDISRTTVDSPIWYPKIKVYKDIVDRHFDREETEILPRTRRLVELSRLQEISQRFRETRIPTAA